MKLYIYYCIIRIFRLPLNSNGTKHYHQIDISRPSDEKRSKNSSLSNFPFASDKNPQPTYDNFTNHENFIPFESKHPFSNIEPSALQSKSPTRLQPIKPNLHLSKTSHDPLHEIFARFSRLKRFRTQTELLRKPESPLLHIHTEPGEQQFSWRIASTQKGPIKALLSAELPVIVAIRFGGNKNVG